jgi:hypothetical protein
MSTTKGYFIQFEYRIASSTTKTGRHDIAEILLKGGGVKAPKNQSITHFQLNYNLNYYAANGLYLFLGNFLAI